jgi:hypothetical protein
MSIIKLGNKTLSSISLGGTNLGNAKNFSSIIRSKHIPVNISNNENVSPPPIIGGGGGDLPEGQWLLQSGTWNDTGIWDDERTWND